MVNQATKRAFAGKLLAVGASFTLAGGLLLYGLSGPTHAPSAITPPSASSERATTTGGAILDARASNAIDLGALHSATRASPANGRPVGPAHAAAVGVR